MSRNTRRGSRLLASRGSGRGESGSKRPPAEAATLPIEGSDRRRFFTVPHVGAIKAPVDAVQAAIVARHRSGQSG